MCSFRRRPRSPFRWGRWCAAGKPSSRCYTDSCGVGRPFKVASAFRVASASLKGSPYTCEAKMLDHTEGRLRFLRRASDRPRRDRLRRGVYLLPSLLTMGNMFCGYACVVYAMRGEYETAAPFIGIAIVLDMLDGRIARMTGTASAFGVEFDSLADIISFGVAPAILSFAWGLSALGRLG